MASNFASGNDNDLDDEWEDCSDENEGDSSVNEEDDFFQFILDNDLDKVKEKAEEGYNALSVSRYGDMALHFATLNSKTEVLRLFENQLRNQPEINTVHLKNADECGTALHVAMDGQVSMETLLLLIEWGADVHARDYHGATIIHELIDMAWTDFEEEFCREKYMTTNPQNGKSYLEKLSILHSRGADMNAVHNLTSLTPLHKWCQQFYWCSSSMEKADLIPERCFIFLNKMLEYGCNRKLVNKRCENHLYYLAQRNYKTTNSNFVKDYAKMCDILVQDSDLNLQNVNDQTILHLAVEFSNVVMTTELLNHDIDINSRDKFGLTAIHLITHNNTEDENCLVTGILDQLYKHGGDLNVQDNHGSTPVHHAIHMQNAVALEYLSHHGADLNIRNQSGFNAVELAIIVGGTKIKEQLGILNDRLGSTTGPGVSDFKTGYYYQRCCRWTGNEKEYTEEAEIIKESQIQKYLKDAHTCIHNTKFIIQNCLPFYDENKKQNELFLQDSIKLHDELMTVMHRVVKDIRNENPLFTCDFLLSGSNAEGTKVGAPDEYDIMFILKTLSQQVVPTNVNDFEGFIKLKPGDNLDPTALNPVLTDDDGFIKRDVLSNHFHKLLDRTLCKRDIFADTCFECYSGTVNSEGECWDIGQLNIKWFGRYKVRQLVKIDMVPVLHLKDWKPECVNEEINILDTKTLQEAGGFLVMKNVLQEIADVTSKDTKDPNLIRTENQLFKITLTLLENAVIFNLPDDIKSGLKLAKTVLLQCPRLACERIEFNEDRVCDRLLHTADGLLFVTNVHHYITSYKIKTALLHVLDECGYKANLSAADMGPQVWNQVVTCAKKLDLKPSNLQEVLKWSQKIYAKMLELAKERKHIPNYFLNCAPKLPPDISSESNVLAEYCEIFLQLTKNMTIPVEFM